MFGRRYMFCTKLRRLRETIVIVRRWWSVVRWALCVVCVAAAHRRGAGGEQRVQQRHRGEDHSEDGRQSETERTAVRPAHGTTPETRNKHSTNQLEQWRTEGGGLEPPLTWQKFLLVF